MTLFERWQKIRDNADAAIKVIKKQKVHAKFSSKDPPTPAQLYDAWVATVADLNTAVGNYGTAAANLVDAQSAVETAGANVAAASAAEKAAYLACVASVIPGGSE